MMVRVPHYPIAELQNCTMPELPNCTLVKLRKGAPSRARFAPPAPQGVRGQRADQHLRDHLRTPNYHPPTLTSLVTPPNYHTPTCTSLIQTA